MNNDYNLMLEKLRDSLEKAFFKKDTDGKSLSEILPTFVEFERDGKLYSYWKIGNIITGDGGKEMFDKAMKEAVDKL